MQCVQGNSEDGGQGIAKHDGLRKLLTQSVVSHVAAQYDRVTCSLAISFLSQPCLGKIAVNVNHNSNTYVHSLSDTSMAACVPVTRMTNESGCRVYSGPYQSSLPEPCAKSMPPADVAA